MREKSPFGPLSIQESASVKFSALLAILSAWFLQWLTKIFAEALFRLPDLSIVPPAIQWLYPFHRSGYHRVFFLFIAIITCFLAATNGEHRNGKQ